MSNPNSEGRVPIRLLYGRSNPTTLDPEQVTPNQIGSQGSPVIQFVFVVQEDPPVATYKVDKKLKGPKVGWEEGNEVGIGVGIEEGEQVYSEGRVKQQSVPREFPVAILNPIVTWEDIAWITEGTSPHNKFEYK